MGRLNNQDVSKIIRYSPNAALRARLFQWPSRRRGWDYYVGVSPLYRTYEL